MRKMKDSGIEWVKSIPEQWDIAQPKALFTLRTEKALPEDKQLTASQALGVIYQDDYMRITGNRVVVVEKDFSILKHVEKGDFVISMRSFQGGLEFSELTGCISSAYVMIQPNLKYVYPPYYKWLFKSSVYINALQSTSNLVRDGQAMRFSNFVQIPLFFIPLPEQRAISAHLDRQCAHIDNIIEKTKASIEEYKKLRQAVITQAVTKGVRGDRPMKDSGIEWIGEIPEEWGVTTTSKIGSTYSGATPLRTMESDYYEDAKIRWIRTLDLNDGKVKDSSEKITETALNNTSCNIMPKSTVCVAMYGGAGTIGKCGILMNECTTNQAVCSIVCNEVKVFSLFLLYQLIAIKKAWMIFAVGTRKDPNISQDTVKKMKLVLPSINEQREIAAYLDRKCAEIDALIAKKETFLAELEAYKKSLIYEYVTGKKEVPQA